MYADEEAVRSWVQILIILITAGIVPVVLSKNTRRHQDQTNQMNKIERKQEKFEQDIKTFHNEIIGVKKEIVDLKDDWVDDLKDFIRKESRGNDH